MKFPRVFAVVLSIAASALAQNELVHKPLVISLFPSVSTAAPDELRTEATFSLNVIGGRIGAVSGLELGTVFNIEEWDVSGAQVAGTFNIVGGQVRGLQMAGAFNFCGDRARPDILPDRWARYEPGVYGAQVASVNLCFSGLRGAQVGWVNVAEQVDGIQVGSVNIAEDAWGISLGVVNIADATRGLSIGAVNINDRFGGLAIATVNIADAARGFQLGIVNIADNLDGEALGIVNLIGNGRHCTSVWMDETGLPMAGAKLGSRHIYTTYWVGLAPAGEPRWISGLGIGGHFRLSNRFFADVDVSALSVSDPGRFPRWRYGSPNGFLKLRPQAGFDVTDRIAVVAGPTASLWLDDEPLDSKPALFEFGAASGGSGNHFWRAWGGLMVGVEIN